MILSERTIKDPPFKVAVRNDATLTLQIEEGLRQAIATGFYKDGDFIPGYVELAGILGVSTSVVRHAIARLIADGLCHPRRGVGLRICSKAPALVGNVLVVTGGDAASYRFYMAKLVELLRRRLADSHLSMTRAIVAPRNGKEDFTELEDALNRHVSLAIVIDNSPGIERRVRQSGVPCILMAPWRKSNFAAGYLAGDTAGTTRAIADHCAACGAKRVFLVGNAPCREFYTSLPELEAALASLGMETHQTVFGKGKYDGEVDVLLREVIASFSKWTATGRVDIDGFRPDMIVFLDDYVAQGGLFAISVAGIRIPDDVQVITLANKGLGPVWLKPLTRFEVDAAAEADAFAELALRCLRNRNGKHTLTASTSFILGETTHVR